MDQNGDGVGLLAAGAAGHPDPELVTFGPRGKQLGQGLFGQHVERLRIAEEARHADQQLGKEPVDLVRILLEVAHVLGRVLDLVHVHSPLDPPPDGVHLIASEIVAGLRPQ